MTRPFARARTSAAYLLAVVLAAPSPALADAKDEEIALLRAQLEALNARLEALETQAEDQEERVAAVETTVEEDVVVEGDTPGYFRLPGSDTEIQFGGYVQADLIYDFDEDTGDLFLPGAIDAGPGDDDDPAFSAHARESRFFFRSRTPTDFGVATSYIEGDFFGEAASEALTNPFEFRLRHAYATLGSIGVGQFWTSFMPIESYPRTVDFEGPTGIPFIRQGQIRYTGEVGDNWIFTLAAENGELAGRDSSGAGLGETVPAALQGVNFGVDTLPDFVASATYLDDFGLVKVAGVARLLDVDPGTEGTVEEGEFGFGVNLSGTIGLTDDLRFLGSFTYGDGVGRYLIDGVGQDLFVDLNTGEVETIEAYGIVAGLQYDFAERWQANIYYGRQENLDTFEGVVGAASATTDEFEVLQTVHANLFWSPKPSVSVGGEVIYGMVEEAGGDDDDAIRVQGSLQVNF